jgi:pimeloyl-ACP methyl ester carboxylesterase
MCPCVPIQPKAIAQKTNTPIHTSFSLKEKKKTLKIMTLYKNIRIIGKGEQTIVLSHGFGASQVIWDNILPFLQKRYRVVLFDWEFSNEAIEPSNYTYEILAEVLLSLLDELKVKKVIFVGHSMAGMISCIASIQRPDLFAHLVLVGASPM